MGEDEDKADPCDPVALALLSARGIALDVQSLFGPLEIERDISLGVSLFERLHRVVEQFNNVELLQPVGQCADIGER